MLNVASVCTSCYMLLHVVRSCCTKLETGQTFKPTTPNISFVPWSAGCSITMLDPFAQFFQHEPAWQAFEREGKGSFRRERNAKAWAPLLGPRTRIRHGFKVFWIVSFPWCTAGLNIVGSCRISLHTTANTDATTPSVVGTTTLGVKSHKTQPKF